MSVTTQPVQDNTTAAGTNKSGKLWVVAVGISLTLLIALVVLYAVQRTNLNSWFDRIDDVQSTYYAYNDSAKFPPDRVITTNGRTIPPEVDVTDIVVDDASNMSNVFVMDVTASTSANNFTGESIFGQSITISNIGGTSYRLPQLRPSVLDPALNEYVLVVPNSVLPTSSAELTWRVASDFRCYGTLSSASDATLQPGQNNQLWTVTPTGTPPTLVSQGSEGSFVMTPVAATGNSGWGLTVPRGGKYLISFRSGYSLADSAEPIGVEIHLQRNFVDVPGIVSQLSDTGPSSATTGTTGNSSVLDLDAADTLTLVAFSPSGVISPSISYQVRGWSLNAELVDGSLL